MPDSKCELKIAAKISPLCLLVRALLERVLPIDVMDRLFADVVADARSRQVTAGAIAHLMLQVISGTHRATFAAFQADQANDWPLITISFQALYERLGQCSRSFRAPWCEHRPGSTQRWFERSLPSRPVAGKRTPSYGRRHVAELLDCQADFVIRELSDVSVESTSRLRRIGRLDGGRPTDSPQRLPETPARPQTPCIPKGPAENATTNSQPNDSSTPQNKTLKREGCLPNGATRVTLLQRVPIRSIRTDETQSPTHFVLRHRTRIAPRCVYITLSCDCSGAIAHP